MTKHNTFRIDREKSYKFPKANALRKAGVWGGVGVSPFGVGLESLLFSFPPIGQIETFNFHLYLLIRIKEKG